MAFGTGLEIGAENRGLLVECFASATGTAADIFGMNQAPTQDKPIDVAANGDIKVINDIKFTEYDGRLYYPGTGPTSVNPFVKAGYPMK